MKAAESQVRTRKTCKLQRCDLCYSLQVSYDELSAVPNIAASVLSTLKAVEPKVLGTLFGR